MTPLEREYKRLCADHSAELLDRVLGLARESDDIKTLMQILNHLTDRAWGKPRQALDVADDREQPTDLPVHVQAAKLREAADRLEAEGKDKLQ